MTATLRKSTSMTLDRALLDEAKALGINLSKAAEAGVAAEIRAEKARRWKAEHAEAIAEYNAMIEQDGVPLAKFRKF